MGNLYQVKEKLTELSKFTDYNLSELKKIVTQLGEKVDLNSYLVTYFNYSLSISHHVSGENIIIADYNIWNLSNQTLENPFICIKLSSGAPFIFNGKYFYSDSNQQLKAPDAWERFNDKNNKEEYWLRPHQHTVIKPFEKISFKNFQIKWSQESSYAGSVIGFTYCDQLKDGVTSLNQINISGSKPEQGELSERY